MAKQKRKSIKKSAFKTHHKILIGFLVIAIVSFSVLTIGRIRAAGLPSVQFVMFCATDSGDRCERNKVLNLLLAGNVRDWYKRQTNGYSFRLISPIENGRVKVIYGSHDSDWYKSYRPSNAYWADIPIMNTFYNLYDEHVIASGDDLSSILMLGFSTFDEHQYCGLGSGDSRFGIVDATNSDCNDMSSKRVVMSHELAHTFGLPHVCTGTNVLMAGPPPDWKPSNPRTQSDDDYETACYSKGCYTIIRSKCSFTGDQLTQLINSPFFVRNPSTTGSEAVYFTQAQADQP
jgi:hypothetical protein